MQTDKNGIIALVNETIKKEQEKFAASANSSSLLDANEYYNKLVEDGTIKKKGNTLRDIDNLNCFYVRPNSY